MRNTYKAFQKGERFGRLVIVERYGTKGKQPTYLCECDCGKTKVIIASLLRNGRCISCGCYNSEVASKRMKTHGLSKTKEYRAWVHAKDRCYNPNDKGYKDWGARGIMMCDRWKSSFENFIEDMGQCPKGLSLDRINNDGNYDPENCKWSTRSDQMKNRRNTRWLNYNGKIQTLSDWAKDMYLDGSRLRWLLKKNTFEEIASNYISIF